ncbi:MAG: diacylglycerol kinase family protein [Burkholderiales bacterium]
MSLSVVVNLKSVPAPIVRQLVDLVSTRAPGAQVLQTQGVTEFRRFAATAAARGVQRVVIAGGDGSFLAAVNALVGSGIELGLLPLGSGNDFARTFHLPNDPADALDVALGRTVTAVDVGLIHCRDDGFRAVKFRFANIAEAGFGAHVVQLADRSRRWVGRRHAFRAGILRALRKLSAPRVRLFVDGVDMGNEPTANLIVGNAQYFGRGMRPLPQARVNDGLFDVVRMRNVSRFDIAKHSQALNGIPLDHPEVDYWRARRIEATSDEPVPIEADGDLIGWLPAAFQIEPGGMRFVVPGNAEIGWSGDPVGRRSVMGDS